MCHRPSVDASQLLRLICHAPAHGGKRSEFMPRIIRLIFVSPSGEPIGALAPFEVATPWWPEAASVVAGARELHEVEVTVLRLIDAQPDPANPYGMGGSVTYAVETAMPPPH